MKRLIVFLVITAGVLAGLWFGLRPAPHAAAPVVAETPATTADLPSATSDAAAPATEAPPPAPAVKRFELKPLAEGVPAPVLQVQVGDNVALVVTSTHKDELHLHGYDLSLELKAGVPGTLLFQAEHAGRFDIELHHAHGELAVLEVQPR